MTDDASVCSHDSPVGYEEINHCPTLPLGGSWVQCAPGQDSVRNKKSAPPPRQGPEAPWVTLSQREAKVAAGNPQGQIVPRLGSPLAPRTRAPGASSSECQRACGMEMGMVDSGGVLWSLRAGRGVWPLKSASSSGTCRLGNMLLLSTVSGTGNRATVKPDRLCRPRACTLMGDRERES